MPDAIHARDGQFHGGAESVGERADGVVYPVCDKMGESSLQSLIQLVLLMLLRDYFNAERRGVFVGNNQFFYYRRGDPRAAVSPDLYVIEDEVRDPGSVPSWKVWEHDGKAPALALEVVSDEYRKDYAEQLLERYEALGVRELVRYDPGHGGRRGRRLLSHFVRDADGSLVAREVEADRVQSAVFGFWLVVQPDRTLRLGLGPGGDTLWPTQDERSADLERARQAAEAEVERLRAEVARLRGLGPRTP